MSDSKVFALRPGDAPHVPLEQRRGPQPVSSLWELFEASPSFACKRPSTKKNIARTAALSTELKLAEFPSPGDVSVWLGRVRELPGKKRGSKMSGNTVTLHRDNLHALFEWARACGKGWTAELGNPVDGTLCPFQRGKALRHALRNVDDVWPFLLATAGEGSARDVLRARAFLCVLRYLGCRISEALSLNANSIERDEAGVTWVRFIGQRNAEGWELLPPKSERARRRLPCRPELVRALDALLASGKTTRVRVGVGGSRGEREVEYLFPYRTHELEPLMARLRGVCPDDFSFGNAWHVFRHTVACELERRGVPVERISEWLGHASVGQTMKYLRTITGTRVGADLLSFFDDAPQTKGAAPPTEEKRAGEHAPTCPPAPPHPRASSSLSKKTSKHPRS